MRRTFRYIIFVLMALWCIGCERKPLYLRYYAPKDKCEVLTTLNIDASLQVISNINFDIQNNLIYNWNEDVYGKLGYTLPTSIHGVFFKNNEKGRKVIAFEDDFTVGVTKRVMIETNTQYYALFYNNTSRTYYDYYTSYSKCICYPEYLGTKSYDFDETFDCYMQPEEQFAVYQSIYIDSESDSATYVMEEDGTKIYHYNMNINLEPASYIYVIQVKIENDNPTIPMVVDTIKNMVINGIPKERELFTMGTTNNRCQVKSNDVKPLIIKENYNIFAERFITYGTMRNYESSWQTDLYLYELGLTIHSIEGKIKDGKVNISKDLKEKPCGGVITITLKNSAIYDFLKEETGGGFGVDVQEWNLETEVEIEI